MILLLSTYGRIAECPTSEARASASLFVAESMRDLLLSTVVELVRAFLQGDPTLTGMEGVNPTRRVLPGAVDRLAPSQSQQRRRRQALEDRRYSSFLVRLRSCGTDSEQLNRHRLFTINRPGLEDIASLLDLDTDSDDEATQDADETPKVNAFGAPVPPKPAKVKLSRMEKKRQRWKRMADKL